VLVNILDKGHATGKKVRQKDFKTKKPMRHPLDDFLPNGTTVQAPSEIGKLFAGVPNLRVARHFSSVRDRQDVYATQFVALTDD